MADQGTRALLRERASEARTILRSTTGELRSAARMSGQTLVRRRVDLLIALAVGAGFAMIAVWYFRQFDPLQLLPSFDIWFEADVPRVVESLQVRDSEYHRRTSVHPLIALMFSTPMMLLRALGVSVPAMAATYVAAAAFALGATMYLTARAIRLPRVQSILLAAALPATAGGMFFMAVPETYAWGACTILIPFIWASRETGRHSAWSGPLMSALSMSVTVTNWIAGIAAAIAVLPLRRAITVTVLGFVCIAALTPLQNAIYPNAGRFLNFKQEIIYTVADGRKAQAQPLQRLMGMSAHSLVSPTPRLVRQAEPLAPFKLSNQTLDVAGSALGVAALLGWAALLVLGGLNAARGMVPARSIVMTGLVLLGFTALHMVYGEDVFLFSLHFAPLWLIVVGWGLRGPTATIATLVLVATIPLSFLANAREFAAAVAVVNSGRYTVDSGITGYTFAPLPLAKVAR